MSEKIFENLPQKGKDNIQRETREAIRPIVKELTEKFSGMGFRKEDFAPAIQKGIDDAKKDV